MSNFSIGHSLLGLPSSTSNDSRFITIDEAYRDSSSALFVLNRSSETQGDPRGGSVQMSVRDANQRDIMIPIPATWVPINLAGWVSKKNLLESRELLNAINSGLIGLISTSSAMEILSTKAAQQEVARLTEMQEEVSQSQARRKIHESVVISNSEGEVSGAIQHDPSIYKRSIKAVSNPGSLSTKADDSVFDDDTAPNPLSNNFLAWVTKVDDPDLDLESVRAQFRLRSNTASFTYEELVYLSKNLKRSESKVWVARLLEKAKK